MKIGIYSICRNESKNFPKWLNNIQDADFIYCLDTGSDDDTPALLDEAQSAFGSQRFSFGQQERTIPFEFDTARNHALDGILKTSPVTLDYLVWIDFDETFEENWISKLKAFLSTGNNQTHKPDSIQFYNTFTGTDYKWFQTRAHRAEKYRWKYCAHEVLLPLDKDRTDRIVQIDILITHPSKAQRNDYTAQLLKSHEKYADGRTAYYLGREYLYNKDFQNAAKYLNDCLFVHNGWVAERGEAANMLADIHQTLNPNLVERYLYFYLAFCNTQREPYIALARYFYKQNVWEQVVAYGTRALSIAKPTSGYLNLYESNYQEVPHDLLCIAYHHLGNTTAAAHHAKQCLHYKPHEKRFQDNVSYYVNTGVIPPENSAS